MSAGRHAIHVLDDRGVSMDDSLDMASDRRLHPPVAISLGPLLPGDYTIALDGARRHRVPIRIVDRDVAVMFRGDE